MPRGVAVGASWLMSVGCGATPDLIQFSLKLDPLASLLFGLISRSSKLLFQPHL
jgi:hypothetical protein